MALTPSSLGSKIGAYDTDIAGKYGLLDSNLFMTNEVPQGSYMSNVDDLIKGLGY